MRGRIADTLVKLVNRNDRISSSKKLSEVRVSTSEEKLCDIYLAKGMELIIVFHPKLPGH